MKYIAYLPQIRAIAAPHSSRFRRIAAPEGGALSDAWIGAASRCKRSHGTSHSSETSPNSTKLGRQPTPAMTIPPT